MIVTETLEALLTWTPFLAGGFGWNMIVALAAMAIGTPVGILFALMRSAPGWSVRRSGSLLTTIARGAPTFVMLFYLVYIIPERVSLGTVVIVFPIWIKASLALGIAVAGYVSDTALAARHALRRGDMPEALLFLPSWTSYFMIIVMASSTASVIGVPEVVHRSETVIGAIDRPGFSFWIYLYAMSWFLVFGGVITLFMRWLRRYISRSGGVAQSSRGRNASMNRR